MKPSMNIDKKPLNVGVGPTQNGRRLAAILDFDIEKI